MTPMWNAGQDRDFNSPERIPKILQDGGTKLLSEAVEKEPRFRELKGKRARLREKARMPLSGERG